MYDIGVLEVMLVKRRSIAKGLEEERSSRAAFEAAFPGFSMPWRLKAESCVCSDAARVRRQLQSYI